MAMSGESGLYPETQVNNLLQVSWKIENGYFVFYSRAKTIKEAGTESLRIPQAGSRQSLKPDGVVSDGGLSVEKVEWPPRLLGQICRRAPSSPREKP